MRTRNADNPKSPPPAKRTPPARKSATKTPPTPAVASQQSPSESTVTPKRTPSTRGKAAATNDPTTTTPETPVAEVKVEDDTVNVTPGTKSGNKKTVKKVVKRTVIRKKPKSGGVGEPPASVSDEQGVSVVPAEQERLEVKDVVCVKQEESSVDDVNDLGMSVEGVKDDVKTEDTMEDVEDGNDGQPSVENVEGSLRTKSSDVTDVAKSIEHREPEVGEKENLETGTNVLESQQPILENEEVLDKGTEDSNDAEPFEIDAPVTEVENEEPDVEKLIENKEITLDKGTNVENEQVPTEINEDKVENNETVDTGKGIIEEFKGDEDPQERLCLSDEERDKDTSNDGHEEDDDDELADVKMKEHDELRFQEHEDFTEAAEERKRRKEFEIFVGGLDRDTTEEEVKRVFQNAGEVVEVRMQKDLPAHKNKGYAFVRFANKEQVARALAEMKNPVIHGKRCGTAPSEDNATLFLGNICNTWTKEAIIQKLNDYSIEGVERITLVADPQHEGLSRGFAFIEFSGRPDAKAAYKRLQKPDAIFGHPDRSAKVAFAEPLREPDPEVLAQVKSVFVDGLPPHWDEDIVRNHLKTYGTIERVMLARNMSTAKRKDFGFVDFTTHEAALACIDGINKKELGDDKMIVRARLSNPLPKMQAVKGGIAGGFRFGHGSDASFSRAERGSGRGVFPSNRAHVPRGRGFYHGPGQTRGRGFAEDYPPVGPYPYFRGRHSFGGRWDDFRGPHHPSGHVPPRYDVDRPRHGTHRDHSMPMRGQPYLPEEPFSRPYGGRPYEDPYVYGDTSRGMKRPYFAEQDSGYTESSRGRPRLDYSDPEVSVSGARYRGGGNGGPSRDYYNYDYSSYYGGDQPYGSDRPYGGGHPYGTGPYGERPYSGEQLYGGERPYSGDRPYSSDRPYGGGRPYGGEPPYGGRYHY
ncbi:putative RNA recognition motif domain, nucleotide-binding alpha-beta plait domain superfamily [Helianthus annuus]|nr:putative RNA recognition motif domain, nucleotide-binding alpha-beta plait domain superfamily [Helianthus annuus]